MNTKAYIITCKTNIHPGRGTTDQGVIDNLVQRDHTTDLPCIYGSTLKGSLREYFEEYIFKQSEKEEDQKVVFTIFGGGEPMGKDKKEKTVDAKGQYVFHDALLLSIPVRSNQFNFIHATCPIVLKRFQEMLNMFGMKYEKLDEFIKRIENQEIEKNKPWICGRDEQSDLRIEHFEEFNFQPDLKLPNLFEKPFLFVSDDAFELMTGDYNLPIVARNQLKNGQSNNLFYEQIIPRESKFFFILNDMAGEGKLFKENLEKHIGSMPVQIGANASIGYGYTSIEECNGISKEGGES